LGINVSLELLRLALGFLDLPRSHRRVFLIPPLKEGERRDFSLVTRQSGEMFGHEFPNQRSRIHSLLPGGGLKPGLVGWRKINSHCSRSLHLLNPLPQPYTVRRLPARGSHHLGPFEPASASNNDLCNVRTSSGGRNYEREAVHGGVGREAHAADQRGRSG